MAREILIASNGGKPLLLAQNGQGQTSQQPGQLHMPTNKDEDAGLAPYFGWFGAIVVIGFLIWRWTVRSRKSPQTELPPAMVSANDRKLLNMACDLAEIVRKS